MGGRGSADDDSADLTQSTGEPTELPSRVGPVAAVGGRLYLLVICGDASWMHRLDGRTVVIGRSETADLQLADASVSRRHAQITVDEGAVTVEDLDSQNGTHVNGTRLDEPRRLNPGDMISICSATLILQQMSPRSQARPALSLPALRERMAEEFERALRHRRSFALACVRCSPDDGISPARLDAVVAGAIEPPQVSAWLTEREVLILLPEAGTEEARRDAGRMSESLRRLAPGVRVGLALCPADAADVNALIAAARNAAASAAPGELAAAARPQQIDLGDRQIIIADPSMARLYALIDRIAASNIPVLVCGETGSGKELAAAAVHHRSPRRGGPLLTLNCAAIQDTLVESELFGYEKGAFTGASTSKAGLLEAADGGTMFLDEIGELSPATQAKLLRALETRKLTRIGDVRERSFDVRLVAATNRNLADEVKEGRFRKDLYFRLSVAMVWVPPLRERKDLMLLSRTFLEQACAAAGRTPMVISPEAAARLQGHDWPGNVRELKNLMEYAAAAYPEPVLEPHHLADRIHEGGRVRTATASFPAMPLPPSSPEEFRPLADEMLELEKLRILQALEASGGNNTQAARLIGMPLRTFFNKIKKHGINTGED